MKLRTRGAALAASVALIATAGLTSAALAAPEAVSDVDFADGMENWIANGDSTATINTDADPYLAITNRANDYDGIRTADGVLEEGVEYTVSIDLRLAADATADEVAMRLVGRDSGYDWIGNTTVTKSWTTVSGTWTPDAAAPYLYIGSDNLAEGAYGYDVDSILITKEGTDPTPTPTPEPSVCEPLESVDFEGADFAPWQANNATVSIVEDSADASNQVGTVTGRTDTWQGIQSAIGAYTEGVEYTFSAKVRLSEGADVRFIANEPGATNEYVWVGNVGGAAAGDWVTIEGTHTFGEGAASAKVSIEVSTTQDYEVDDIVVTPSECGPVVCEALESVDFEGADFAPWQANNATVSIVEDSADASNQVGAVTGRTDTWQGIQSAIGAYTEGVEYTFSAKVRLSEGADVRFIANEPGATNEYVWVGNVGGAAAGDWVTIEGTHTFGEGAASAKVSIEVSTTQDYEVDDIVVTPTTCDGGDGGGPGGPPAGTVLLETSFEDGLDGWVARQGGDTDHTVAVTTEYAQHGSQSAGVTGRDHQGDGLAVNVTGILTPGAPVELTAWVRMGEGEEAGPIWLTLQRTTGASNSYDTLGQFTGITNSGWTQVTASFTPAAFDDGVLYFETAYDSDNPGNTSDFYVDNIKVSVPDDVEIQDLTPIKDTTSFPAGVAIDSRETSGAAAELLLRHFNQVTPENHMKPEAWYDADGNFTPHADAIAIMDFAQANDLAVYGHVLVWHSQTPDWFFQDDTGAPLTTSAADKAILRERMRTHIFDIAEFLSDEYGLFGSDTNPLNAWDVVNEVISDSGEFEDGMRRSEWYRILGEEFVDLAFEYADEAFNDTYAADGVDRPVMLFINDYNTEQSGKRGRYKALIERLLDRGAPLDGVGHQFHLNLSFPVEELDAALNDFAGMGLYQAVTELDVPTGTPESEAKFIDQGYYYERAYEIFREHEDELWAATVWGLIDSRSWRDANGGPLVFDDGFQAKPAYYGIVGGDLPAPLRSANSFAGDVELASGSASAVWKQHPMLPAGADATFQTRWASDHLTVLVRVDDDVTDADDAVTLIVGTDEYVVGRDGSGFADAVVTERSGGYDVIAHLPLSGAAEGDTLDFDARTTSDGASDGWNAEGVLGTLTLVEATSYVATVETPDAPVIDGTIDDVWAEANPITTDKEVSGSDGSIGTFRTLWKDQTLYVLAEVEDDVIDTTGSDPWTQDSVEIYVDAGNAKNGSYRYDDTQIRISADGVVSFGTGDETFQANRLESAVVVVDGGYVVEAAISLLEYGGVGTFHGLDVQVNDAADGARHAIRNWADPTGAGYQSTARWGVTELVPASVPGGGPGGGDGGGDGGHGGDGGDKDPLGEDDLHDQPKGGITVPASARAGEAITVGLGVGNAGIGTRVYLYSEPTLIGMPTANTAGDIRLTIPADTVPGSHSLAVYDLDGNLIGWAPIEILPAAAADDLANTGAEDFAPLLYLALVLVVLGSAAVAATRPRRGAARGTRM